MSDQIIAVRGAAEHNLKQVNLDIPKNQLVVLTGLSGSGKSSFAFDTLYAEGQRRYVESLSSYARQFLGVMQKPKVESITGLSPAISIDQKTTSHNPRSTVGTITEIYDYLRLLFARAGRPHDPVTGAEVQPFSLDQIVGELLALLPVKAAGAPVRFLVMAPVIKDRKGEFQSLFANLRSKGYNQVRIDNEFFDLHEDISLLKNNKHSIEVVIDRIVISKVQLEDAAEKRQLLSRLTQDIEQALGLSNGWINIAFVLDPSLSFPDKPKNIEVKNFTERRVYPSTGQPVPDIEPRLFSFNTPHGACARCSGLGSILTIDIDRLIAPSLTLPEGAIIPFARMLENDTWFGRLVRTVVETHSGDWHQSWLRLSPDLQEILLHGTDRVYNVGGTNRFGNLTAIQETWEGFIPNLERRYRESTSEYIRQEIEKFMQKNTCPECHGRRLKPEALSVTIDGLSIADVTDLSIQETLDWITQLSTQTAQPLTNTEQQVLAPIAKEIISRLQFLTSVGLDYLTLSREANTLAGGEAQRIRLASQIGTGLSGVLYVLDEPTIGLHQRDNHRLIKTLQSLRDLGNTVVVVEHDRDVMEASDRIVDFGPAAGELGGHIVAQGTAAELRQDSHSLTGQYLARKKDIWLAPRPADQRQNLHLTVRGARAHNLKNLNVEFPLHQLVCLTGISGSGKSTLLHDTLYYNLLWLMDRVTDKKPGAVDAIQGHENIQRLVLIDQSPIGRTPRSNPATYTKIFDLIRETMAETHDAKERGYKAGRFSFNVKGGRCEACQGEGQVKIEMQFLPDVYVDCDVCHGTRYNRETLEVFYHDKNIAQILDMTVTDALHFFGHYKRIQTKLQTLEDVGLGYIRLGQPAPTLSGGEAQRVKLSKELSTNTSQHTLYLLDEPTTGLHFEDVRKLLGVLDQLIRQGNSVIMIEHNLDVIKNADWIIDLGPEGGDAGGQLIAVGTPDDIASNTQSWTGKYLAEELKLRPKHL
jgi:excinuclease ABC subunit A